MKEIFKNLWFGKSGARERIADSLAKSENLVKTKKEDLVLYLDGELVDVLFKDFSNEIEEYLEDFAERAFYEGFKSGKELARFILK